MLIPLKRIFLSYSFSLFAGTRQLLLSNASSMKQFSNIYIRTRARSGSESFLFDAKKGKTSITAKRHEQFLFVATPIFPFFRERKDPRGNCILSRSESSTRFPSVNWNGSNSSSRDEPSWVGILGGMPPRCWRY